MGKNVSIFEADMSSSVYIDNKNKRYQNLSEEEKGKRGKRARDIN